MRRSLVVVGSLASTLAVLLAIGSWAVRSLGGWMPMNECRSTMGCPRAVDCPFDVIEGYYPGYTYCTGSSNPAMSCQPTGGYYCYPMTMQSCGNQKDCVTGQFIVNGNVAVACTQTAPDCVGIKYP